MLVLLFGLALLGCLFLVPLGLPGIWLMVLAGILYGPLTGTPLGWGTVGGTAVLAVIAEAVEFALGAHMARRFGGSRRSAWGSILGSLAGAMLLSPLPVLGPMTGAFVGAFAGAWIAEWSLDRSHDTATRTATGALIGRVVAVAVKVGLGMVIAVWLVAAAALATHSGAVAT
jgi:uncharacterized protein YqgC (DUF456 family)